MRLPSYALRLNYDKLFTGNVPLNSNHIGLSRPPHIEGIEPIHHSHSRSAEIEELGLSQQTET